VEMVGTLFGLGHRIFIMGCELKGDLSLYCDAVLYRSWTLYSTQ